MAATAMRVRPLLPALALLAGCAGSPPVSDMPVKIGRPYTVRGITYVPPAAPGYDRVGYASWYGNESGNRTANGERFRAKAIAGAHPTLPLPSYVEVTALDTGRTLLVRINDRGPFAAGRIIDLSRGAARDLGVIAGGVTAVRIRTVIPTADDAMRLRRGKAARPRRDAAPSDLALWRARMATGG